MSDHQSSSDEDLENILQLVKVPKNYNYFQEIVPQFGEEQFQKHFRINKRLTQQLANRYANSVYYNWHVGDSEKVSPLKCIIIFLWFVANEAASYRDVSDRFNISQSTLFKIVRRLTYFLSNLSPEVIMWPNDTEKLQIEENFKSRNLPGVIGVIDGTHIKIDRPREDSDSYLNRKHFYSIQAQIVCDHKRKIRDIFVGFPGSVHDSRVLRNSLLYQTLPEKCNYSYHIIGDGGYPCLRHLLTPFRDNGHLTRRQRNYNYLLSSNRYVIEHCFGIWKQKFRQLYHVKLKDITVIVHLIRACAVLHNLAIEDGLNEGEEIRDQDIDMPVEVSELNLSDDRGGIDFRNEFMDNLHFVV